MELTLETNANLLMAGTYDLAFDNFVGVYLKKICQWVHEELIQNKIVLVLILLFLKKYNKE